MSLTILLLVVVWALSKPMSCLAALIACRFFLLVLIFVSTLVVMVFLLVMIALVLAGLSPRKESFYVFPELV